MLILWKAKEVKSTVKYNRLITLQHGHFRRVRRMKNGGVWRRLAGSLSGTRQIYLCGAVSRFSDFSNHTRDEIHAIPGIGPRAMLELDKELKKRGIHYKQNHTV